MKQIIVKLKKFFMQYRVVWFTDHQKTIRDYDNRIKWRAQEHKKELEEQRKAIDGMLSRLTRLKWSRETNFAERSTAYRLTVMFAPEFINLHFGYDNRIQLEIMADYLTSAIRAEILTSKFLRDIREEEMERYRHPSVWPPSSADPNSKV